MSKYSTYAAIGNNLAGISDAIIQMNNPESAAKALFARNQNALVSENIRGQQIDNQYAPGRAAAEIFRDQSTGTNQLSQSDLYKEKTKGESQINRGRAMQLEDFELQTNDPSQFELPQSSEGVSVDGSPGVLPPRNQEGIVPVKVSTAFRQGLTPQAKMARQIGLQAIVSPGSALDLSKANASVAGQFARTPLEFDRSSVGQGVAPFLSVNQSDNQTILDKARLDILGAGERNAADNAQKNQATIYSTTLDYINQGGDGSTRGKPDSLPDRMKIAEAAQTAAENTFGEDAEDFPNEVAAFKQSVENGLADGLGYNEAVVRANQHHFGSDVAKPPEGFWSPKTTAKNPAIPRRGLSEGSDSSQRMQEAGQLASAIFGGSQQATENQQIESAPQGVPPLLARPAETPPIVTPPKPDHGYERQGPMLAAKKKEKEKADQVAKIDKEILAVKRRLDENQEVIPNASSVFGYNALSSGMKTPLSAKSYDDLITKLESLQDQKKRLGGGDKNTLQEAADRLKKYY